MNKRENSDFEELQELLWRVEEVLKDPEPELSTEEDFSEFLYDDIPEGTDPYISEEPLACDIPQEPDPLPPEPEYVDQPLRTKPVRKRRRKKRRGLGCLGTLLMLIAVSVAAVFFLFQPPRSDASIGAKKPDTATVLICGTDKDGTRTDTMMLLYMNGKERQVSLLSLPRDSYTITSAGKAAKLNSAFGRGGTGKEGMENLLDYVEDIIGYRPDGYVLVNFKTVRKVVDIMGGVDVEVPMDMTVGSTSLKAGYQHLNGKETLTLLRFRKGYAMADLKRVEVQRTVLKACIEQWLSPAHIGDALEAISLLENDSLSSLSMGNYIWMVKTMLLGMGNFRNDTLPGTAEYRGGASYYVLSRSKIAELINEAYNPYQVIIDASDLNIAG